MKKKKLKSKDQNQIKKNRFNLFLFIDKNAKIIFWIIFIYGILIRLFYFYSVANSPAGNILLEHTDSFTYHNIALKIIEGDWSGGQKIFYYNPGYAYFLAFIYSIFGVNYNYVRFIQILLNIFTIPCGYLISYKITGNRFISLFTALFISSYGPLIYHTNMILIVGILPSLLLYLFYLFLNLHKSYSLFYYAGIGLLLSIIILLRPNFILFDAIFIFFIYYFHNKNKWLIYSFIYLFFLILLIIPFTIHNYKNTKEFILISANAGINFFIGNNIEADGVYSRPNILIKYSEELEKLKITSPTEQSNYWLKKSFEYIKKNPFHFLKLQIKKFFLFWWGKEIASNDDYEFEAKNNFILKYLVLDFALIGPLAFVGILFLWQMKNIYVFQLYVFSLFYIFSTIIFLVISRYKTPIVPILSIFSAFIIYQIFYLFNQKQYKRFFLILFLVICFFGLFNFLNFDLAPEKNILSYINEGIKYEKINDYQKALEMYNKAMNIEKNYSPLRYNIGIIYYKLQKYEISLREFLTAIKIDNKNKEAYFGAALCYEQLKDYDNAIKYNELAIEKGLKRADVLNNLARLYAITSQFAKAEKIWQEMLINYPDYSAAKENLEKLKKIKK